MAARKDALLIPTGGVMHLHVVLNDPIFCPVHGFESVLLVNVSSIRRGFPFDPACELKSGCHQFVQHPSFAFYARAVVSDAAKINQSVQDGSIVAKASVSDDVYWEIIRGLETSRFVPVKIKRFAKQFLPMSWPRPSS